MNASPGIDVEGSRPAKNAGVVLGEDWVGPDAKVESELRAKRERRGLISINRSPLARKIITFNLLAIVVLVAGVLYLNPFRDSLVLQRERGLVVEAQLIAEVIEGRLPDVDGASMSGADVGAALAALDLSSPVSIHVFDPAERLIASSTADTRNVGPPATGLTSDDRTTLITDFLNGVWDLLSGVFSPKVPEPAEQATVDAVRGLLAPALEGTTRVHTGRDEGGSTIFTVATPIVSGDRIVGVLGVTSPSGEIDTLVRNEREQVLQMFVIATLVSIGLSLVLASTIANPLSDLAAAAEIGRERNSRKVAPGRVRIPDLTARPDEIGRLSGALRGMVTALYDRIDANEQFAADVAHEIKNPLASLRSAIGSLRFVQKPDQRDKLLDVIEHDVRRLDRLVSDISNASRLDSELVKEEEEPFNLVKMITNI